MSVEDVKRVYGHGVVFGGGCDLVQGRDREREVSVYGQRVGSHVTRGRSVKQRTSWQQRQVNK